MIKSIFKIPRGVDEKIFIYQRFKIVSNDEYSHLYYFASIIFNKLGKNTYSLVMIL